MLAMFIGIAGVVCGFTVVMFMFGLSCEHSTVVVVFIVALGALVALAHISAMLALCVMKASVFNAYFVLQVRFIGWSLFLTLEPCEDIQKRDPPPKGKGKKYSCRLIVSFVLFCFGDPCTKCQKGANIAKNCANMA